MYYTKSMSRTYISEILLLLVLLAASPLAQGSDSIDFNMELSSENITSVYKSLTKNITKYEFSFRDLKNLHDWPTCLITYSGNAFPLFGVGELNFGDYVSFHSNEIVHSECTVFGVGAFVGKGRALVFSHSAYVTQYEILQRNLKDWASNQTSQTAEEILNLNDLTEEEFMKADLGPKKIIWWTMNFNKTKSPEVKISY